VKYGGPDHPARPTRLRHARISNSSRRHQQPAHNRQPRFNQMARAQRPALRVSVRTVPSSAWHVVSPQPRSIASHLLCTPCPARQWLASRRCRSPSAPAIGALHDAGRLRRVLLHRDRTARLHAPTGEILYCSGCATRVATQRRSTSHGHLPERPVPAEPVLCLSRRLRPSVPRIGIAPSIPPTEKLSPAAPGEWPESLSIGWPRDNGSSPVRPQPPATRAACTRSRVTHRAPASLHRELNLHHARRAASIPLYPCSIRESPGRKVTETLGTHAWRSLARLASKIASAASWRTASELSVRHQGITKSTNATAQPSPHCAIAIARGSCISLILRQGLRQLASLLCVPTHRVYRGRARNSNSPLTQYLTEVTALSLCAQRAARAHSSPTVYIFHARVKKLTSL